MSLKPTETLESEHRFIQKVVAASAILADQLAAGVDLDIEVLLGIVEFMRTYADRCHHGKEEDLLFPALERRGVPMRGCPVGALLGEHKLGRTAAMRAHSSRHSGQGLLWPRSSGHRAHPQI